MKRSGLLMLAASFAAGGLLCPARADQTNQQLQPYIEQLKQNMAPAPSAPSGDQPYIDQIKKSMPPEKSSGSGNQPYIDKIRETDPENHKPVPTEPYTDTEQRRLGPSTQSGAIDAVASGHSELQMKRPGEIKAAGGMRVGIDNIHAVNGTPDIEANPFRVVYPDTWVPDITLFGEMQPFHSEWAGNIGLTGSVGYTQFRGIGQYVNKDMINPVTNAPFGSASQTTFRFNMVPASVGLDYRFNLFKYIRPYVMASGIGIAYFETRSDTLPGYHGLSYGIQGSVGVAILLDFLSRRSAWSLYSEDNIKHTYATIEYAHMKTTSGEVEFEFSGVYAGMAFEF